MSGKKMSHECSPLLGPTARLFSLQQGNGSTGRRISCFPTPPPLPWLAPKPLHVLEVSLKGEHRTLVLSHSQFVNSLSQHRIPFRDLRALLKSADCAARCRHPSLLPRPNSGCFILQIEQVKLLCFSDKCLVLSPDQLPTRNFVLGLKHHLCREERSKLFPGSFQELDFEHTVLESALESVVGRLRRHLQIIKPALEMLLQEVEHNPETGGLKRLLAVKKSLGGFELKVESLMKVLRSLLGDDEAILSLYLTRKQDKVEGGQEEVELLLNSYAADLDDIDTEVKILIDVIEDTDQFISAHMDSVRNEIIKMSLFTEVGGVILGFGAVVSGIFGMNLDNKMDLYPFEGAYEDKVPWPFLAVCGGILMTMLFFVLGFTKKFYQLRTDTSSAHSFTLLKNIFSHVDDLEEHVFSKEKMGKGEFKESVEKITGLRVTDREADFLARMVEAKTIEVEEMKAA